MILPDFHTCSREFLPNNYFLGYSADQKVAAVLPATFAFDGDGKKEVWRAGFLARLKTLTQQEARASVKCGWDPNGGDDGRGARREVQLPDLSLDQKRRAM